LKLVDKLAVAHILEEVGTLLELTGANPFKCRAYHNAARTVRSLSEDLSELVASGELSRIKGIGEALAEQISTLVREGRLPLHRELLTAFPPGFLDLLQVPGLGPKKLKILFEVLGIESVGELEYACQENRLLELEGFGAKTQQNLLDGIASLKRFQGRFLLSEAVTTGRELQAAIAGFPEVREVALAGSLRRRRETVKEIDLVVASEKPGRVMRRFVELSLVEKIITQGPSKSSVLLKNGLHVDLRCVAPEEFASALFHFTGSREHNLAVQGLAKKKGLKLNEYGLFRGRERLAAASEEELYQAFGLNWIPPELREDRGELLAAAQGRLPQLVKSNDLQGVFHIHTTASDGSATLKDLVSAARQRGWRYLGICDHSRSAAYAHGLEIERVHAQWREIEALNAELVNFKIFKGIESDILADGRLDYPEEILAGFDFVIASIHSRFKLGRDEQTERLLRAAANPFTTMLGHLTGRLLLARDGYQVDAEAVIAAAVAHGVILELNANPHRLDLDWRWLRRVKDLGGLVAINPDAHALAGLDDVDYGIGCARKGWLAAADVFNTRSASEVAAWFEGRKKPCP
jgi:DNA polymerase (family 10)